jgi:hypothetical protein
MTAGVVFVALIGGLFVAIAIGLVALGLSDWWSVLRTRGLAESPYDLLFATITGSNVVMLALYFTIAGALLANRPWSEDDPPPFSSLWIFWPCLLEALCVAVLGGRAWGFPPFSGSLLALAVIGLLAAWAYARLAGHVIKLMSSSR